MTQRPPRDEQFWNDVEAYEAEGFSHSHAITHAEWALVERAAEIDPVEAQWLADTAEPLPEELKRTGTGGWL